MKPHEEKVHLHLAQSVIAVCLEICDFTEYVNIKGHIEIKVDSEDAFGVNISKEIGKKVLIKQEKDDRKDTKIVSLACKSESLSQLQNASFKNPGSKALGIESYGPENCEVDTADDNFYGESDAYISEMAESSGDTNGDARTVEILKQSPSLTGEHRSAMDHQEVSSSWLGVSNHGNLTVEHAESNDRDTCRTSLLCDDHLGKVTKLEIHNIGHAEEPYAITKHRMHCASHEELNCGAEPTVIIPIVTQRPCQQMDNTSPSQFSNELHQDNYDHCSGLLDFKPHPDMTSVGDQVLLTTKTDNEGGYRDQLTAWSMPGEGPDTTRANATQQVYSYFITSEGSERVRPIHIKPTQKPVACDFCGQTFSRSYDLKIHFRIHTGERPHVCDTCGKTFNRSTHLKRHQRTHTADRPFKCKICGKAFNDSSNLCKHKKLHSEAELQMCNNEELQVCDICGKVVIASNAEHVCIPVYAPTTAN